jgi:hypothetical protein
MANAFSKEERVAFEDILAGFEDALVLSRNVSKYSTDGTMMERSSDTIWRPQPYIAQSFAGTDMTANFQDNTQLSVPASLSYSKSVPWILTAKELRDQLQEGRIGQSAYQKLASDVNVAIMNIAYLQGTLVVPIAAAASGFANVALCEAIMNEQGVNAFDRYLALSTRDYNGMAADLAGRDWTQGKVLTAYEQARIGMIASFDTYKLDYANRLAAATATSVEIDGAGQYYTPAATSTATTGEVSNVDNRYQTITVTATGTIAAGDCFTIEDVYAVHHITKQSTGQLKTFRVITGTTGDGDIVISPPIISGGGGTDAELQYQNVDSTPADDADITFLNIDAAYANPFWYVDAFEILPGRYAVPTDAGTAVLRGTTDNGMEVVWQKFYDINTMNIKYRLDIFFGVVCKQPEMAGIMLFSQIP